MVQKKDFGNPKREVKKHHTKEAQGKQRREMKQAEHWATRGRTMETACSLFIGKNVSSQVTETHIWSLRKRIQAQIHRTADASGLKCLSTCTNTSLKTYYFRQKYLMSFVPDLSPRQQSDRSIFVLYLDVRVHSSNSTTIPFCPLNSRLLLHSV